MSGIQQSLPAPVDTTMTNLEASGNELTDKNYQSNEELPYFQEKYPGKTCTLCNLPERSQLGQGEMLRFQINEEEQNSLLSCFTSENGKMQCRNEKMSNNSNQTINRRQKGQNKNKSVTSSTDHVDELEKIGHLDLTEFSNLIDSNNYFYVHRYCAMWSFGVSKDQCGVFTNVAAIMPRCLQQSCSYCNRFGASVICKMSCSKNFHFPCVAAAGGIQIIQNLTTFCKEHTIQAQLICKIIGLYKQIINITIIGFCIK